MATEIVIPIIKLHELLKRALKVRRTAWWPTWACVVHER